jgi:hypothetical protein
MKLSSTRSRAIGQTGLGTLGVIFICLWIHTDLMAFDRHEQVKIFETKIRGMLKKGPLPIIDVEFHYGDKIEVEKLKNKMDENGVALTWLGPNEKLGSEESLRLNESYPDQFVPTTVHGDGKHWHNTDKNFLTKLTMDVQSGKYFAMGEFEARHYRSDTNTRDVHMPVDSEAMQVVFELSSSMGLPFLLHHEAEDVLLPEIERMLVKFPTAKLIWCHGGRNRNPWSWKKFKEADGARDFLRKYPNLYFDLVQAKPGSKYPSTGYVDAILYTPSAPFFLDKEWKKLLEEFPDRFLIGSDINTGRFSEYDRVMDTFRSIVLKEVKKEAAERIAFKNAWKLMIGEEFKE